MSGVTTEGGTSIVGEALGVAATVGGFVVAVWIYKGKRDPKFIATLTVIVVCAFLIAAVSTRSASTQTEIQSPSGLTTSGSNGSTGEAANPNPPPDDGYAASNPSVAAAVSLASLLDPAPVTGNFVVAGTPVPDGTAIQLQNLGCSLGSSTHTLKLAGQFTHVTAQVGLDESAGPDIRVMVKLSDQTDQLDSEVISAAEPATLQLNVAHQQEAQLQLATQSRSLTTPCESSGFYVVIQNALVR